MEMSLNRLVYDLIELYRSNYKVTDSLDERNFAAWIQDTRAMLIKQRMDKPMVIPDEAWVQDLGAIEMEPVDSSVHGETGKYILRSKEQIPLTIHYRGEPGGFTRLGPADRLNINYRIVTQERALTSGNGKFNQNQVYAFMDGNYIVLISKSNIHKSIKYIHAKGLFNNPIEAYEFVHGVDMYDWDMYYPMSNALVNDMKKIVVSENFQLVMVPMDDKTSNSIDNIANPSPEQEGIANPMRRSR
jgi:hypothetical protein